jgi:alcohol dehydrogenase class IV
LSPSDLKPPKQGEWVEFADDRRKLLLFGGPVTDPLGRLGEEGWDEFELLSTPRALADAAGLGDAASRTHLVADGGVPEASEAIVGDVGSERLVAFGGGRVIDSAKAIAAVRGGEVAAIPTTLSGAPLTAIHRLPVGHDAAAGVRPVLVIAYSEAMTSAPEPQLRATAMNALAHGSDSLFTPLADEDSRATGLRGAELIAQALDQSPGRRDRAALALGALLCGIAVDRAGIALHHVLGQTSVRVLGIPHAETYAALLPQTMEEMRGRAPDQARALAEALGTEPDRLRERITELAGDRHLSELGADRDRIDEVVEAAMARPELEHMTPGKVTRDDLTAILQAAW